MILAEHNQMRPPDWRWQRAKNMAIPKKLRYLDTDDRYVRKAAKYLRKYRTLQAKIKAALRDDKQRNDVDRLEYTIDHNWPDVHMASEVHRLNDMVKWGMEAMIIADMTPEEMEKDLPCSQATIETYEKLYYDVRSRLDKATYRMTLYAPIFTGGIDKAQCDIYWKFVAYHMGPEILRLLWYNTTDAELIRVVHEATLKIAAINGMQAVVSRDINKYNIHDVVEEAPIMRKLLATGGVDDDDAQTATEAKTSELIDAIGFGVRSMTGASPISSEFRQGGDLKRLAAGPESDTTEIVDVEIELEAEQKAQRKRVSDLRKRLDAQKEDTNGAK